MNKASKMVKTSLFGYCYGCQTVHYAGEQYRDNGKYYCKHRGSRVDPFHPPIPIEIPQEWLDEALEDLDEPREPKEDFAQPSRTEQIIEHLEMVATIFDVDIDQHSETWKSIVAQFLDIADVKEAKITKMLLRETK